jgi:predicted PurR-regulated permease PerM
MALRLKSIFLIIIGLALLWFLYIERAILTPFILAAIFAYIFNPVVNFFSNKLKFPRTLSVVIIYLFLVTLIVSLGVMFSQRVVNESFELKQEAYFLTKTAKIQINSMPDWVRPTLTDMLSTVERTSNISYPSVFSFFPQVFSRILGFIIFLFSAFYFLKEGRGMIDKMLNFVPHGYRIELDILLRKINSVLVGYLRGQLFLVFIVSLVLFILLTILGVRFSLMIAVFSGFAEIVPIIGPILAATVAAIVAYLGGTSNFGLDQTQIVIAVIIIYFVVRQIQDYFINPVIMGKITKLHPLIILFAVIAGEHTAGILGLILAVPIAGILKIIFEYSLEKINRHTAESAG